MILEEKQITYSVRFVDPRHKPDWLVEVHPSGKLPLVQDGDHFVMESGNIADYICEKFPQPSIPTDEEGMSAGGGIFAAFRKFILNREESLNAELAERLEDELKRMNEYLSTHDGPFFGGTSFSSADIALLPRLYRMKVALWHFKKWQIPDSCLKVKVYIEQAMQRPSFQKTVCGDQEIINTWKLHLLV